MTSTSKTSWFQIANINHDINMEDKLWIPHYQDLYWPDNVKMRNLIFFSRWPYADITTRDGYSRKYNCHLKIYFWKDKRSSQSYHILSKFWSNFMYTFSSPIIKILSYYQRVKHHLCGTFPRLVLNTLQRTTSYNSSNMLEVFECLYLITCFVESCVLPIMWHSKLSRHRSIEKSCYERIIYTLHCRILYWGGLRICLLLHLLCQPLDFLLFYLFSYYSPSSPYHVRTITTTTYSFIFIFTRGVCLNFSPSSGSESL